MQIIMSGKPTKVPVALCRTALRSFAKHLLTPQLYKKISIRLYFVKECNSKAECIWNDEPHRGKSFTINIRRYLSDREMLLSLAHEMVHIMQWATGIMRDFWSDPDKCTWRGKSYKVSDSNYWFCPWEVEAFGLEIGLYKTFKKEQRYGTQGSRTCRVQRRPSYQRA